MTACGDYQSASFLAEYPEQLIQRGENGAVNNVVFPQDAEAIRFERASRPLDTLAGKVYGSVLPFSKLSVFADAANIEAEHHYWVLTPLRRNKDNDLVPYNNLVVDQGEPMNQGSVFLSTCVPRVGESPHQSEAAKHQEALSKGRVEFDSFSSNDSTYTIIDGEQGLNIAKEMIVMNKNQILRDPDTGQVRQYNANPLYGYLGYNTIQCQQACEGGGNVERGLDDVFEELNNNK